MPPNILQLQREVESLSDERLIQEAQMPNMFPAYLTQQEMVRREQERNAYQSRKAQQPTNTVHDRLIERALSGIGSIPQQLSPEQEMFAQQAMMDMSPEQMMQQQMMMQSPMPQPMADGGLVGYQDGGSVDYPYTDSMAELGVGSLPAEIPPYGPWGASWPRTAADAATVATLLYLTRGRALDSARGLSRMFSSARPLTQAGQRLRDYAPKLAGLAGIGSLFVGRDRGLQTPDLPEDHPVFQYYGEYMRDDGTHVHSLPRVTQSDLDAALAMSGDQGEDVTSLIPSMPAVQRQEIDLSQYFQMTPEEQAVLDRARADAQSLESRIDTQSDRLSAQANILSNVARAMARGQVPTAGEPLRELQTAQRGRREGIMDESRAMEMAALAQEAGLSRAEQEALMERAMVEDERSYQEALRENERQRFNQYVTMSQSDNPKIREQGFYGLQSMGVANRGDVTGNQRAELDQKALVYYTPDFISEVMKGVDTDEQFESAVERVRNMLDLHYSAVNGAPPKLISDVVDAMLRYRAEE